MPPSGHAAGPVARGRLAPADADLINALGVPLFAGVAARQDDVELSCFRTAAH